jgi:hypothetical protein
MAKLAPRDHVIDVTLRQIGRCRADVPVVLKAMARMPHFEASIAI